MLAEAGHIAEHVADVGLLAASDEEIWTHSRLTGACLVTKDEDFPRRWSSGDRGVPVLWLRIGNCSRRALGAWFMPQLPRILDLLAAGETLVELR